MTLYSQSNFYILRYFVSVTPFLGRPEPSGIIAIRPRVARSFVKGHFSRSNKVTSSESKCASERSNKKRNRCRRSEKVGLAGCKRLQFVQRLILEMARDAVGP